MNDREELRKKLRDKIKGKREPSGGPQLAQRLKDDPTTTMLQMGLDDASLLSNAKNIVKNPEAFLKETFSKASRQKSNEKKAKIRPVVVEKEKTDSSDDEEAPPPEFP